MDPNKKCYFITDFGLVRIKDRIFLELGPGGIQVTLGGHFARHLAKCILEETAELEEP